MNVLMIATLPPPITGLSLATKMALDGLQERGHRVKAINATKHATIDQSELGVFRFLQKFASATANLMISFINLFNRWDAVYLTPGYSLFGVLRYGPIVLLARLFSIPTVAHFHNGSMAPLLEHKNVLFRILLRWQMRSLTRVIVLLPSFKESFVNFLPEKSIHVCSCGVKSDYYLTPAEVEEKWLKKPDVLRILYLSNLIRTKGIIDLMEALLLLKAEGSNFVFDIAGAKDPECAGEFEALLLQLGNNARYHGVVTGNAKRDLLRQAHIFALPTYFPAEGQPISILEAYASGTAVLTTYHGGIAAVFEDGVNGVRTESRHVDRIKQDLKKLSENMKQYALHNFARESSKYTEKAFVDRVESVLAGA